MNQREARRQAAAELAKVAGELATSTSRYGLSATDSDRLRTAFEHLAQELTRRGALPSTDVPADHPALDLQFDHGR